MSTPVTNQTKPAASPAVAAASAPVPASTASPTAPPAAPASAPAPGPTAVRVRLRVKDEPELRHASELTKLWPSWAVSAAVHCVLILTLGLTLHFSKGAPGNGRIVVNLSITDSDSGTGPGGEGGTDIETSSDGGAPSGGDESDKPAALAAAIGASLGDAPPGDPGAMLPSATIGGAVGPNDGLAGLLGGGGGGGGNGTGAGGGLTAGGGPRRNGPGGNGETSVFGVKGNGRSFVYVFDRSGSMGGSGRSPLQVAKEQMLASIESLAETHRFQIVYYNQNPTVFNPAGAGRLAFATESSRNVARTFVHGIIADGGTDHELALKTALNMGPDAIFFLTDADSALSGAQLEEIRRKNGGRTTINCIEFGLGRQLGPPTFLQKLADQNSGNYGYVDITTFRVGK